MNTHDKYGLPPLPKFDRLSSMHADDVVRLLSSYGRKCARAAIEADRKHRHLKEKAQLEQEWSLLKDMQAQYEVHRKRIAELEAARIAYASEFPPNKDGEPDVGSIHENIRKLKVDLQRRGEPVAYRLLRKNADGEWVTDGRPWCDGVPDADLANDSEKSGQYRIEYAFAAPQTAEPVRGLNAEQLAEILTAYITPEIIREALEKLENAPWELSEPVKVPSDPAVAAIQFALETDEAISFLHCWNEGNFDAIRREWPEAPEAVFIGADPMHPGTRALLARYTTTKEQP